jgi:hypothetical protein
MADDEKIIDTESVDENQTEETTENSKFQTIISRVFSLPVPVLAVTALLLLASTAGTVLYSDEISRWIKGEPDYKLIEFDSSEARGYAQSLVDLGHPEWTGRMSGTAQETATAEFIRENFSKMGLDTTLEEFDVPMFVIGDTPRLSICTPGTIGFIPGGAPCSSADFNRDETEFTHREDFVLQGYSGSTNIRYQDNKDVYDLGNGSEEADWESANGAVALVHMVQETESNTVLFERAGMAGIDGLILVNERQNCDELVSDDCVPYFKSVSISSLSQIPENLGFIMVSKSVGQTLVNELVNGDARISFFTDVVNTGEATIYVPCGIIEGKSESLIIIGAHHDTVYNGPGAVDDTSGTSTVMEIARQFGLMERELGKPTHTIYFCTWGGEEEGLFGSSEWVSKHQSRLHENLRLYVNLDMNHVDSERNGGVTLFGNSKTDVELISGITKVFKRENQELANSYEIRINKLSSDDMPYNSDHAPFVYEIDPQGADGKDYGRAVVCYGSGSAEYHTYLDGMDRFNEESLAVSGIIYGSLVRYLAWGEK